MFVEPAPPTVSKGWVERTRISLTLQSGGPSILAVPKEYFWDTLALGYARIAGILRNANYTGYVSLEMEGREGPATAVPKSLEVLRKAFA